MHGTTLRFAVAIGVLGPTRKDIDLRERTLWRMLYETAARSAEAERDPARRR